MPAEVHAYPGFKVVVVRGEPRERARALGVLHGQGGPLSPGAGRFFIEILSKFAARAGAAAPLAEMVVDFWIQRGSVGREKHPLWPELLDYGLAAGFTEREMRRLVSVPDLGTWAGGGPMAWLHGQAVGGAGGCSSVARVSAERAAVARNLDFGGVGEWDARPLLVVNHPATGSGDVPHVAFATEGLPWASVTGVNAEGLFLAVHQHFSAWPRSRKHPPLYLVGEELLRKCRTVEAGIDWLRGGRGPTGLWTFVLVDLMRGKAAAVEAAGDETFVREPEDGVLAQTNHAFGEKFRAKEVAAVGTLHNSRSRFARLAAGARGLAASNAKPWAEVFLGMLGAEERGPGAVMGGAEDVIKTETIDTIALERKGGELRVWWSVDAAPASSGRFANFRLEDLWRAPEKLEWQVWTPPVTPEARARLLVLTEAYLTLFAAPDVKAAAAKVWELGKKNPGALPVLLRARAALEVEKPVAAKAVLAEAGPGTAAWAAAPEFHRQSWEVLAIATARAEGKPEEARQSAGDLYARLPADSAHRAWAAKLAGQAKGWRRLMPAVLPDYNFFSGDLDG